MKNKILFVFIFVCTLQFSFSQDKNPPFDKGMILQTKDCEFVLGYSLRDNIIKKLGNPQNTLIHQNGGEDWNWDNMTIDEYKNKGLKLIYSEKDRLIQIIYQPNIEDSYTSIFNITSKITMNELKRVLVNNKIDYSEASPNVLWVNYFSSDIPMFNVTCGFKFNDQNRIVTINYGIDGSW